MIATWTGTAKTSTLALALRNMGYKIVAGDGFLDINYERGIQPVENALEKIASSSPVSADSLLSGEENFITEKHHPYLSPELLLEDAVSSRIDLNSLPELARGVIEGWNESIL